MNNKEFLICVDSDGCVMDGMTIKHIKCFYPCIAELWNLPEKSDKYLNMWSKINLFSQNRGINRFKGLEIFLKKLISEKVLKEDIIALSRWCETTKTHSESSLEMEIAKTDDQCLKKVLVWSRRVNEEVEKMPEGTIVPFDWTRLALHEASKIADVAIVSSTRREVVYSEWSKHNLMDYVKYVMTQEDGAKDECIKTLLSYGYEKDKSMMIGDSPGDMQAVLKNNILFYPIIAGREEESWEDFIKKVNGYFYKGIYKDDFMQEYIDEFNENLRG